MPRTFPLGAFPARSTQAVRNVRNKGELYLNQVEMRLEEYNQYGEEGQMDHNTDY